MRHDELYVADLVDSTRAVCDVSPDQFAAAMVLYEFVKEREPQYP
jgi:hypothetical protein